MKQRVLLIVLLAATMAVSSLKSTSAGSDPVVYRAQIRFQTGSVENAGTDDDVFISLRSGNRTWLDYTYNDWQRGSNRYVYDLLLTNVNRLSDISRLVIGKLGSDGWCIQKIDLWVNGELLYNEELPGRQCRWLDNGGGHATTYVVEANNFRRIRNNARPPFLISTQDVERMIQTTAGNFIAQTDLYWGDRGSIGIYAQPDRILHVDLRMRWSLNNSTDPAVDMSYDLRLNCSNNRISVSVINPRIDTGRFFGIGVGIIGSSGNDSPLMYESAAHVQDIIRRRAPDCEVFFTNREGRPVLYFSSLVN